MPKKPFYADGLRFSCARCSSCCRHESGFVFLSEKDLAALAGALDMGYSEFQEAYCRWVPSGGGLEQLSLKERSNFDCIFWDGGCTVYDARPLQCRTFPFWPSIMADVDVWEATAADCPGVGRGALHGKEEIEGYVDARKAETVVSRRRP